MTKSSLPQPILGSHGADDPGPRNVVLDKMNPNILQPPSTDNGGMPNLKFPFSMAHSRLEDGGWAREVTVRECPALEELAIVNMRLGPGVVRELHWHKEAEWAYVTQGRVRFYLVDEQRNTLVEDLDVGDLWFAPAGFPHAIQGLDEGTEFVLIFNDGNFSENETLLVTELFAHTPKEVLAKNFGVTESAFDNIPSKEKYIFRQPIPQDIEQIRKELSADKMTGKYVFRGKDIAASKWPGGSTKIIDINNFDVTSMAMLMIEIEPGGMREIHWHPDADEIQYYLRGQARMTVFNSVANARTFDYSAGDVGYVPKNLAHYIENTGKETVHVLNVFSRADYRDISLNQWLALTPSALVQGHLDVDEQLMNSLRATRCPVVK